MIFRVTKMAVELITKSLALYHIQVVRRETLEKIEEEIRTGVISKIVSGKLAETLIQLARLESKY